MYSLPLNGTRTISSITEYGFTVQPNGLAEVCLPDGFVTVGVSMPASVTSLVTTSPATNTVTAESDASNGDSGEGETEKITIQSLATA